MMVCPMCDHALEENEVLVLQAINIIDHCQWDAFGNLIRLHSSKPDEYTIAINSE